jgi:hypothetical protein
MYRPERGGTLFESEIGTKLSHATFAAKKDGGMICTVVIIPPREPFAGFSCELTTRVPDRLRPALDAVGVRYDEFDTGDGTNFSVNLPFFDDIELALRDAQQLLRAFVCTYPEFWFRVTGRGDELYIRSLIGQDKYGLVITQSSTAARNTPCNWQAMSTQLAETKLFHGIDVVEAGITCVRDPTDALRLSAVLDTIAKLYLANT